ncbi:MAG: LysM peptidoglycan-binding domain-containing protein [Puniceicoccales bacterium]|jgi:membrane-bound lytic murein transglycosylase D|nr:LysM peptidoglycan-binding domain-containing protein [Puniceicoccales bacterium]
MKNVWASIVERRAEWSLLLVVLLLSGCETPFGSKTVREPSPEDTIIVTKKPTKQVASTSFRGIAAPRRPEPEPEPKPEPKEVLIVVPDVVVSHEIKPSGAEYTVRKGDCLSWIAKKFKIPLKNLLDANALDKNAKLFVGQKLILPGTTQEQIDAMNTTPAEYIVQKGDCLSLIAHKYGVSIREIRMANNLKNDRIIAGKKLIIPEGRRYINHEKTESDELNKTKKEKNFEVDADGYYTIRRGDSLSIIASKAKVSVHDLQNWNNISDSAKIQVGERILVKNKTITPEDIIKKEPIVPAAVYPESPPIMHDTDFFGAIDEIPVVHVQD